MILILFCKRGPEWWSDPFHFLYTPVYTWQLLYDMSEISPLFRLSGFRSKNRACSCQRQNPLCCVLSNKYTTSLFMKRRREQEKNRYMIKTTQVQCVGHDHNIILNVHQERSG